MWLIFLPFNPCVLEDTHMFWPLMVAAHRLLTGTAGTGLTSGDGAAGFFSPFQQARWIPARVGRVAKHRSLEPFS